MVCVARLHPGSRDFGPPRPPTVLHVVDGLEECGPEAVLVPLVAELARQELARSVVVTAACRDDAALLSALRHHAEAVVALDQRRSWDPRTTAAIARIGRHHGVDVIHSQPGVAHVHARGAALLLRKPHVTTVHTQPDRAGGRSRGDSFAEGLTGFASARVVAPCSQVADAYAQAHRGAAGRLRVVASSAPALPTAPPDELHDLRAALSAGRDVPIVLCVTRLEPSKGVEDLIDASRRLIDAGVRMRVVIAGDGSQRDQLEARVRERGLEHVCALLGPRRDVGSLLAVADLFCLPSHHEGVPPILLEALAAGLPSVATRVGGVPELIMHGRTGLLVPPGDPVELGRALKRVIRHPVFAEHLADGGRGVASARTPRAFARGYAELYRELVAA
jgi:glycosyltransferase involved in cell wall biosynthesis